MLFSRNIENQYIVKLRKKAEEFMIWNALLQYGNESYLIYSISCATQLYSIKWRESGPGFSSFMAFLALVYLIAMPFINIFLLRRFKDRLRSEEIQNKYGAIYDSLKIENGNAVLYEPSIGLGRILMLTFSLIFLQRFRYFQIFIANATTTTVIIYNGMV